MLVAHDRRGRGRRDAAVPGGRLARGAGRPAGLTRAVAIGTLIAVVAGILAANPAARWREFKQVGALDVQTTYNAAHL